MIPAACPQCLAATPLAAERMLGEIITCRICGCRALAVDWVATQRRMLRKASA